MFKRMLKNDLKRNRTMNLILFIFVIIAAVFFASGLSNLVSVINGSGYFFEKAGIGDYQLLMQGDFPEEIPDDECIKSYRSEKLIFVTDGEVKDEDGKDYEVKNVGLVQSVDDLSIVLFDQEDDPITEVEPGKVYVSGAFESANDMKPGDKIIIEKENVRLNLTYVERAKDAFLGSDMMGNPRFVLNDKDYKKISTEPVIAENYTGEIFYIDTDDTGAVSNLLSNPDGALYSYPVSMVRTSYIMNMIIALMVMVISICLMIVSFVVLKFTISFSVDEDFGEIGILKAVGIGNFRIRSLYFAKYIFIAVCGSLVGLFLSIPFSNLLLSPVNKSMLLGNRLGIIWQIIGATVVMLLVFLFAYISTNKIKRLTPIDAVRSGQTGERFRKRRGIRIGKANLDPAAYLALNDFLSSPKRYLTIVISFALCTLIVLILVNTTNTMNSDRLIDLFGARADVYIMDTSTSMKTVKISREESLRLLDDIKQRYTNEGMPCNVALGAVYGAMVEYEGNRYNTSCQHDFNTKITEFKISEGSYPVNKNEILVADGFMETTGTVIGDSIRMDIGNGFEDYLITGSLHSMMQFGNIVILHEDAEPQNLTSPLHIRLNFTDSPDEKTIASRIEKIKELTDNDEVFDVAGMCRDSVQVYDILKTAQRLVLLIVLIVVILVTVLMERSFIAEEKKEIAISKAIGLGDNSVIRWHIIRFAIVAGLAMILAMALSVPFTKLTIGPVFGIMGSSAIDFNYDIIGLCVYPVIVLLVTVLTTAVTALYTKKITSRDTAGVE